MYTFMQHTLYNQQIISTESYGKVVWKVSLRSNRMSHIQAKNCALLVAN